KKEKRVKLINFDKGHSAAFARNRGAEAARGDVVYFIDADVEIEDKMLIKSIVDAFEGGVGAVAVGGKGEHRTFLQKCQHVRAVMSNLFFKATHSYPQYVNALRKDIFDAAGGFDEKIFYYEDRDFGRKIAKLTKIGEVKTAPKHLEPSTLSEIIRQAKYVGKGVSTYNLIKENPLVLIYPPYPFFWLVFAACILLSFLNSIFVYAVAFIFFVLLAEVAVAYYLTRMLLPSICFVFFISPLRAFVITYSFILNKLKR
ncbi:MAG: glycosyltransferase, partial [Candidatus Micrarchaeia archaeon]